MVTSKIELLDQIRQRNANELQTRGLQAPILSAFYESGGVEHVFSKRVY